MKAEEVCGQNVYSNPTKTYTNLQVGMVCTHRKKSNDCIEIVNFSLRTLSSSDSDTESENILLLQTPPPQDDDDEDEVIHVNVNLMGT